MTILSVLNYLFPRDLLRIISYWFSVITTYEGNLNYTNWIAPSVLNCSSCMETSKDYLLLLRLPVGYGGVLNSPRFCLFSLSKVGLPLMGYTAVQYTDCYLSPCQHDF